MIKKIMILSSIFSMVLPLLLFVVLISDEVESSHTYYTGKNLSPEVLQHQEKVTYYCDLYGISEYVYFILAIIQVESGGLGEDVMQSSESLGLPSNSLGVEESIQQGCRYFSELLEIANQKGLDNKSVVQAYNYGGGFLSYVEAHGRVYTYQLAEDFSREKSNGEIVTYNNPIAIDINGGWRYKYGNMFYVSLVYQYLLPVSLEDEVIQAVINEALKYEGYPYVFGGHNPTTSFDCSGLVQWCFRQAGIELPRTASLQYEAVTPIPLEEAQIGDLVFFHSTYGGYSGITHVGIYMGDMTMFHAGSTPIGYTDLTSAYWQAHLVGAGRVQQ